MNKKYLNIILFSMQEAFISLFPYLLFRASCTLMIIFNDYFQFTDVSYLANMVHLIYELFPILISISLSMHLAKNFQLNVPSFTIFSIFVFLFLSNYFVTYNNKIYIDSAQSLLYAISIPLFLLTLLSFLKKRFMLFFTADVSQEKTLKHSFHYLYIYVVLVAVYFSWHKDIYKDFSHSLISIFTDFSVEVQGAIHLLISHILWLFGIHGTTTFRYTFDMDFYHQLLYPSLPYENFFSTFVIFGGAGSTLSLIIAILIVSKDKHYRLIAKSSIPFSFFNINELIIYALPVALNKRLIIPFIAVPFFNFILSMIAIKFDLFTFHMANVPWTTPPLLSGYLLTDSLFGAFWQLMLILIGVFIYRPFVLKENDFVRMAQVLSRKLDINKKFDDSSQDLLYYNKRKELDQEKAQITNALQDLIKGEIELYYQPQIDIKNDTIYGYEALLRLIKNDQEYPPIFLSAIEKAGLEELIDIWTVKRVSQDIKLWQSSIKNSPMISINIYPKTLLDEANVTTIIESLSGKNIKIEILEKGFSHNFEKINNTLNRFKEAGIEVAIDDFGSDESNLSLLGIIQASTVKLDRSLIVHCDTDKGRRLYKSSCETFKEMDFLIIAEGVETDEELAFTKECAVDIVQGWYFSKALPLPLAIAYYLEDKHKSN